MPSRASNPNRPRDPNLLARSVMEDLIGEKMDGSPLDPKMPEREKNPAAVALSKLGASKGGLARAAALSGRKRSAIAKKAAAARCYSPAKCIGCEKKAVIGDPAMEHVSTSYIERQNLTMRMSMRRFTRLTNGFSKKLENHSASVALYMMFYNFGRKHKTLGTTPAVKAGLTDHIWSVEEIIGLLQAAEPKATRAACSSN